MLWSWLCPRQGGQGLLDTGDQGLPPVAPLALSLCILSLGCNCQLMLRCPSQSRR